MPPWYLSFGASEEIGAKHNYCDDFSDDYFEVYNISVAQNLTILKIGFYDSRLPSVKNEGFQTQMPIIHFLRFDFS